MSRCLASTLEKLNTDEWKHKSEQGKALFASSKGGSLHTGGSIRFAAHWLRLEKTHGRNVSHTHVFEETLKKKKEEEEEDGTNKGWVGQRASETYEGHQRRLEEWQQTQPDSQPSPKDMTSIWTHAADGVNKGRVYGFGIQQSSTRPAALFSGASASPKEIETTWTQTNELAQQRNTAQETISMMRTFMEKYGNQRTFEESNNEEIETDKE